MARTVIGTHRHPFGKREQEIMASVGAYDPSRPLPQAARGNVRYAEWLDEDTTVAGQREGGVTRSLLSNGGEREFSLRARPARRRGRPDSHPAGYNRAGARRRGGEALRAGHTTLLSGCGVAGTPSTCQGGQPLWCEIITPATYQQPGTLGKCSGIPVGMECC